MKKNELEESDEEIKNFEEKRKKQQKIFTLDKDIHIVSSSKKLDIISAVRFFERNNIKVVYRNTGMEYFGMYERTEEKIKNIIRLIDNGCLNCIGVIPYNFVVLLTKKHMKKRCMRLRVDDEYFLYFFKYDKYYAITQELSKEEYIFGNYEFVPIMNICYIQQINKLSKLPKEIKIKDKSYYKFDNVNEFNVVNNFCPLIEHLRPFDKNAYKWNKEKIKKLRRLKPSSRMYSCFGEKISFPPYHYEKIQSLEEKDFIQDFIYFINAEMKIEITTVLVLNIGNVYKFKCDNCYLLSLNKLIVNNVFNLESNMCLKLEAKNYELSGSGDDNICLFFK